MRLFDEYGPITVFGVPLLLAGTVLFLFIKSMLRRGPWSTQPRARKRFTVLFCVLVLLVTGAVIAFNMYNATLPVPLGS
jgi:hypothetical protein